MRLFEKLNKLSNQYSRITFEELVARLEEKAKNGEHSYFIDEADILSEDIRRLKEEGLETEYKKGEDYNYWLISWNERY